MGSDGSLIRAVSARTGRMAALNSRIGLSKADTSETFGGIDDGGDDRALMGKLLVCDKVDAARESSAHSRELLDSRPTTLPRRNRSDFVRAGRRLRVHARKLLSRGCR